MSENDRRATAPSTPPPLPAEAGPAEPDNMLAALLKAPWRVAAVMAADRDTVKTGVVFLAAALVFHAVYGLAMGLFGGWSVGLMAAAKVPLIALCSLVLCLPSLYVFSCVGGATLSIRQTFMLGASCLAMIGLLLMGLAPVAWLFSVSTESLPFVVVLTLAIWLIAVAFAVRYIGTLKENAVFQWSRGIGFWFVVFMMVSLQMTTTLRPVLVKPGEGRGWWTQEKAFFLAHFGACLDTTAKARPPSERNR